MYTLMLTRDMRKIHFYKTKSNHCLVEDFLDSLSGKQAQKVVWVLKLIREMEIAEQRRQEYLRRH